MSTVARPRKIVRQDGSIAWRVQLRVKGRMKSGTFGTKRKAEQWAKQTRDELISVKTMAQQARETTIGQMIADHLEKFAVTGAKVGQLKWWHEQLGDKHIDEVTSEDVAMCLENLAKTPAGRGDILGRKATVSGKKRSPATINRYQAALSACYSKTYRWLKPSDNPCREIRRESEGAGRNRWLRDDERRSLLEACASSDWEGLPILVTLALGTGCRAGELTNLRWEQVDGDCIHLLNTKNGDSRTVPLVGPAKAALEKWKRATIARGLVFPGATPHKPMDWRSHWNRALKRSGIENFRFHDLRHSAASYLVQSGVPTVTVAAILGHRSLAMTKRYSHLEVEHQAVALKRIADRLT